MSSTDTPTHRPRFYEPDAYRSEDSVGWLMKRIVASIVAEVDRRLVEVDLTDAQWGPLLIIRKHGAQPVAELARHLAVDAAAMTRTLDRLEKKGLCRRVRCSDDRRVVRVELTSGGELAASEVPAHLADVLNAHLAGFSEAEWHQLVGLLQRMNANGDGLRRADSPAAA